MLDNYMVVRHSYDDHSYIDGKNDTSLTDKGVEIAKKAIIQIANKIESNEVTIRHSLKKRGRETAEIFGNYLLKKGFNCNCVIEPGLTELYQGQFDFSPLTHLQRVDFLQSCWDDFEECRLKGDYEHNFGIKKDNTIILTPGSNHLEWSKKITEAYLSIINDMENNIQSINIAHRGVIYMLERLTLFVNQEIEMNQIEQYQTRWMEYCQDYKYKVNNLNDAKVLIKEYRKARGI